MHVIGTAGHVDHGKSTLVKALTGIDPDRLAEEKAREMTIDLGFAWLTLGDDDVGIVDVPGHRDFIENMLAGVGGIDLALFVIAADEGIMPQTREHLAILDLLQVNSGIVALTKMDLIEDPEWQEIVLLEIDDALSGSVLQGAPIIPVSAHTGQGLDHLRSVLLETLGTAEPRVDKGRPRLAVDRVFTLSGFGTIITGTLLDGRFHVGDQVEIQPKGLTARIRGLQTHKQKLQTAKPGSRVAINLTGINRDDIQRGDVVTVPNLIQPTILLDVHYRHLKDADGPLKHNIQVKLFSGASEIVARTRVIGQKQIDPGQEGWLQLALKEPLAAMRGDRFILRRPSPAATLGGGRILDPNPGRRRRRFKAEEIERLKTLTSGTEADLLLQTLSRIEPVSLADLVKESGMDKETAESTIKELEQQRDIKQFGSQLITFTGWQRLQDELHKILKKYHQEYPLRLGIPREELRSRLRLPPTFFNPLIEDAAQNSLLAEDGPTIRLPEHQILFTQKQQENIDRLLRQFRQMGVSTPSVKESKSAVGEDVYHALLDLGVLLQLNKDVVYEKEQFQQISRQVTSYLQEKGQIDAAQTRDLLNTSRKYAIAVLEYLDDTKVTRRTGDYRVLSRAGEVKS